MDPLGRNLQEQYWGWQNALVRQDVYKKSFDFGILMQSINYDFNLSSLIRNSNGLGARNVYYWSDRKRYDKRGTVGTHHYTSVQYLSSLFEIKKLQQEYTFVAIENNTKRKTIPLPRFKHPKKPLFVFGSEGQNIVPELLELCEYIVEVPLYGSVRSLNVASCAGIVMYDFLYKRAMKWQNRLKNLWTKFAGFIKTILMWLRLISPRTSRDE